MAPLARLFAAPTFVVSRFACSLALTLALAYGVAACHGPAPEADVAAQFLNTGPEARYVGDEACASCHEDLYRRYQSHGMARSFYRLTPERAVEDFAGVVVRDTAGGFFYTAYREGDRFVQEEYRLGPDGEKTHQLVRSMDYVVGSGTAARTYLTEVEGRLYELPLTWYTQDGGRWGFSPGYEEVNARFSRTIPTRCMACHNDVTAPVPYVEGKFAGLADGIGCERCHGPGSLHVEARLAEPEPADSVDRTIVNPAHLPLERRLDVCQQCHLQGTVSLLREGADAYSFRPAQRLDAHRTVFALANPDPHRISVISHADRMRQSPCFRESGAMDCTTCHNPHEGFRTSGPAYFNQKCQRCHPAGPLQAAMRTPELRQQHGPSAHCFSCHMPKVATADVPHASFTDHFIRVVTDDDRLAGAATARNDEVELTPYFERDREGAEGRAYAGMAYVAYGRQEGSTAALSQGVRLLDEALEERPEMGEAQFLLGFARMQLGQWSAAMPALEEAVRLGPNIPERLNALAQVYERLGRDPRRTEELYRQALRAQPAQADVRVNLGRFLEAQERLPEAEAEYRRAAQDSPWLATAHYNLGTVLLRKGDAAGGAAALRRAVELEPDHADALTNLGVLLATRGAVSEAEALFRRAAAADPRNANAQANLALFLANAGDLAGARRAAEQALAINPNQATAQQVLQALMRVGA